MPILDRFPHRPKEMKPLGKPHWLPRNRTTKRPHDLLFLDTETKVLVSFINTDYHTFRLGIGCHVTRRKPPRKNTETWRTFHNAELLLDWIHGLALPKRPLYLFASNPSFDLWITKFYTGMRKRGWRLKFLYVQNMAFILSCRNAKRKIVVLGTQNFLPVSVARLGEMVALPKLDTDPLSAGTEAIERYCKRDVEIIRDFILWYLGWCDSQNAGAWAYTLSGQSRNAFTHRYMTSRLFVHRNPIALEMEREAYKGGRVEAFRIGDLSGTTWWKLDVNSLYASIMQRYDFPTRIKGIVYDLTPGNLQRLFRWYLCTARVTLRTDDPAYGILIGKRLCFPTGEFKATLCTGSLQYALGLGHLRDIREVVCYERAPIFRAFVGHFYRMRLRYKKSGDALRSKMIKRLLNMLYGKFGMAPREKLSQEEAQDDTIYRRNFTTSGIPGGQIWTQLMGTLIKEGNPMEHPQSIPSIAAHVTDYARCYIHMLIAIAGRQNCAYCDTDSLFVNALGYEKLQGWIDPDKLGMLKCEGKSNSLIIFGAKDYIWESRRVLKGVGPKAREVEDGVFEMTFFPGLNTLLGGCEEGEIPVEKRLKRLDRIYRKGNIQPDGSVAPLGLSPPDALSNSSFIT